MCVITTNGRLFATVHGAEKRQLLSVGSWEDSIKAHQVISIRLLIQCHDYLLQISGPQQDGDLAVGVTNSTVFGQGSGGIVRVEWMCTGNETELLQCTSQPQSNSLCRHERDAGVRCYGEWSSNSLV